MWCTEQHMQNRGFLQVLWNMGVCTALRIISCSWSQTAEAPISIWININYSDWLWNIMCIESPQFHVCKFRSANQHAHWFKLLCASRGWHTVLWWRASESVYLQWFVLQEQLTHAPSDKNNEARRCCSLTCGIRLTWMLQKFSLFTLNWNCLKASMKGILSMSPTVPPNCKKHTVAHYNLQSQRPLSQQVLDAAVQNNKTEATLCCSAYLYNTNLRFYIVVIDRHFGLFHHPFLDGVCDVWHHWKKREKPQN